MQIQPAALFASDAARRTAPDEANPAVSFPELFANGSPGARESSSPRADPMGGPASGATESMRETPETISETQAAFRDFVGQTLFGQMLKSMRSTVGKPAYLHGGKTEEVFQQQMDQVLVEKMSDASADQIADPMFELFMQSRKP
jgi:hypothetical protein